MTLEPPDVPFRDWSHFVDTMYATRAELVRSVRAAVEADTVAGAGGGGGEWLREGDGAMRVFAASSVQIMAKLALGTRTRWTDAVAKAVLARVACVQRAYRTAASMHSANSDAWPPLVEFRVEHLVSMIEHELGIAFGGQSPWHFGSFCDNFVGLLMERNFRIVATPTHTCFSTKQVHELCLTFASGTHRRLGRDSPLVQLDADICAEIFSRVFVHYSLGTRSRDTVVEWLC